VDAGGLMSDRVSLGERYRRSALSVDTILTGARPADLPVERPTTFALDINRKTAQALDLILPPRLLVQVDEVIR
jgi:putative tryptophan/tyrosine transport system substrate-binding protein